MVERRGEEGAGTGIRLLEIFPIRVCPAERGWREAIGTYSPLTESYFDYAVPRA